MACGPAEEPDTEELFMAQITLIVGPIALFAAAFFTWYTVWHHRVAATFERVPVSAARSAHVVRTVDVRGHTR